MDLLRQQAFVTRVITALTNLSEGRPRRTIEQSAFRILAEAILTQISYHTHDRRFQSARHVNDLGQLICQHYGPTAPGDTDAALATLSQLLAFAYQLAAASRPIPDAATLTEHRSRLQAINDELERRHDATIPKPRLC